MSDMEFNEEVHQKFVTHLSDGTEYELMQGGSQLRVTRDNIDEYAKLLVNARMDESKMQIKAIRDGINFVIP
jgi:hypothetical protein